MIRSFIIDFMPHKHLTSDLLQYLAVYDAGQEDPERIPPLGELSVEMGISVAKLREQLEVARTLGFVEVRPRLGIRRKAYSFLPAVSQSLLYAIAQDWKYFKSFSDLRNRVESAFWYDAICNLSPEDHLKLQSFVDQAKEKLNGNPIRIPHSEHRKLHLTIFSKLENPFVNGLLEAYWDAYEAVELNSYADYTYLQEVWDYHQNIVEAICRGDYEASHQAFVEHTELLRHRPVTDDE